VPELTGVTTSELYSWQSGIALVRAMAARLDDDGTPQEVSDWLNEREAIVTGEIGRRRSR
jgi:hypothetical protein